MKKTKAFTLAEVLIVMGIIGVLAMLTVPNMLSDVASKKRSTSFKKAYTSLSNVYASYFTGANQAPSTNTTLAANNLYVALISKFNVDYFYKFNNGAIEKKYDPIITEATSSAERGDEKNKDAYDRWIKTNDGFAYLIERGSVACASRLVINEKTTLPDAKKETCMTVTVDYNAEKSPNKNCAEVSNAGEGSTITEDAISKLEDCDQLTFLLSDHGFTAGNSGTTVGGAIIGGNN